MGSHVSEGDEVLDLYTEDVCGSLVFLEDLYYAVEGFSLLLVEHPDTRFSED